MHLLVPLIKYIRARFEILKKCLLTEQYQLRKQDLKKGFNLFLIEQKQPLLSK